MILQALWRVKMGSSILSVMVISCFLANPILTINMMSNELKKNSLGLIQSVIMGVAGSAPSYSISATMATLIAAVGVLAPASLFYCGLIMVGIVMAYRQLNGHNANAGASYAWVSEIFGMRLGFFAGWALMVASALFMVSATVPAASATFLLFAPQWVDSQTAVTLCALAWLTLVTVVVVVGVGLTARIQMIMTICELAVLTIISVLILFHYGPAHQHLISWQQFSLKAFTAESFASGAVIALFFFWGWDVTLNLNEETESAKQSPGLGAVGAVLVIIAAFTGFAAVVLLALSDEQITQAGTNVIFVVADKILPAPWNYLGVLALMLSTIGTVETSILQFTRTMFSQSRDGLLHPRWAKIHPIWNTPYSATLLIFLFGSFFLIASLASKDISEVMSKSINVIGVQAAYYYGLAGFACAWHFRHKAMRSVVNFLLIFLWPLASSLVLWWAAALTISGFDAITMAIAIGSMSLGCWPLWRHARLLRKQPLD